jgi:hypothetical protein
MPVYPACVKPQAGAHRLRSVQVRVLGGLTYLLPNEAIKLPMRLKKRFFIAVCLTGEHHHKTNFRAKVLCPKVFFYNFNPGSVNSCQNL